MSALRPAGRRRLPVSVWAAGSLLLLSGCGSASSTEDTPEQAFQDGGQAGAPSMTPEETVRTLITALGDGDGETACGLYTTEYANEELLDSDTDAATCAEAITADGPNDYYRDPLDKVLITDEVDGATWVGVTYESNPGQHTYVLTVDGGQWKVKNDWSD